MYRITLSFCLAAALLAGCEKQRPEDLVSSGKQYLAKKDAKAAIIQFKNALQKNPESAEARFLLGKSLMEIGDPVSAGVELRKAAELRYPEDQVSPVLARALNGEGQPRKVVDQFKDTTLSSQQAMADLKTSVATAYARLDNADQANAALKAALSANPDFPAALILQSRMQAASGDFDGATRSVDDILAKHPQESDAWLLKADLLTFSKADYPTAIDAYRKALALKPDLLPAHSGIISIELLRKEYAAAQAQLAELKKLLPNHPQAKYFEAQIALQKEDYAAAKQLADQLLRIAPDNVKVMHLAGAVEFQRGSLIAAEVLFSKALQAAPDNANVRKMLVQTYLRLGQANKALPTVLPLIEAASPNAVVLALAGETYLQLGDVAKADALFSRAAKLNPADARNRTALALTQLAMGNVEAAFGELQTIASTDAGTTADMALISSMLQRKNLAGALKAIDGLERKQPGKPMAPQLRGRIQMAQNDIASARKSFERALAADPRYFPATESLAQIDLADAKPESAKGRYETLLKADPKNLRALLALAELKVNAGGSTDEVTALIDNAISANPADAGPRLALVDQYLRAKDYRKALVAAQDALGILPDLPALQDALGRVHLASGDFNQALTSFNKLAASQPGSVQPYLRLADVYLAQKNTDAAIQSLKRALMITPDSLQAQRTLIAVQTGLGKVPEALALARTVQTQRPGESAGYALEGDILSFQKNWESAAAVYRTGLTKVRATDLALKLHTVLLASGKRAEADKFADEWRKAQPKDASFLFYLGDIALSQKNYAVAQASYQGVADLQPNNAIALNNIAWVLARQKKAGALAFAERAVVLQPNQPALLDTLAMVLAQENQVARAVEVQKKAVQLQPDNPALRLSLAKFYIAAGQKASARDELERLAKLGDKYSGRTEVSELLKTL
ncbi:PEP-CTERM system TPR-repeat protein PrsT [soil metagenome]